MAALPVSSPAAHRTRGQVSIHRYEFDLRVPNEPVHYILTRRPQPRFYHDAQLNPDGSRHQPNGCVLQTGGKVFAAGLARDHRDGRGRIDDEARA